jgi:hypothetical protein
LAKEASVLTTRERFDAPGMVAAFDAARQARGYTWARLHRELRVSPSTIRNMGVGDIIEMDGVLWATAWMDRSVESFYRDPPADAPRHALRERIDVPGLHALIDARRTAAGMAWAEVAAEITRRSGLPIAPGGLTRMKGGGRVDLYHTLALADWLGRPVASLARNLGW